MFFQSQPQMQLYVRLVSFIPNPPTIGVSSLKQSRSAPNWVGGKACKVGRDRPGNNSYISGSLHFSNGCIQWGNTSTSNQVPTRGGKSMATWQLESGSGRKFLDPFVKLQS